MGIEEVPAVVRAEAKGWLLDCGLYRSKMTNRQMQNAIQRSYGGGWNGFLKDVAGLTA